MSVDGFVAGLGQDEEHPLGVGASALHEWIFETRTGRGFIGGEGGETGVDDDLVAAGFDGIGATIMGRNMFGPVRGDWATMPWLGWWGPNPPFHHRVFVLTNFGRDPIEMEGGTTFHFVTEGPEAALTLAREAAGDLDIRLGGGAATVRQFLDLGLIDRMHIAVVPVLLGSGERIFDGAGPSGYTCTSYVGTPRVAHYHFAPQSA